MSLPRAVHAVVFDMDGLLVDTEILCRDAMMQEAQGMGLELPLEVFLHMVGTQRALSEQVLVDHFGPSFPLDRFHEGWLSRFYAVAEAGVLLKDGVLELLDHLDGADLKRAIATSSPHREVDRNLAQHGLSSRFHAVVARGDYERGKPAPDPFLRAAEVLGAAPAHCLALEDSHNGVRAAHAAGMMTVMVPDLLAPTTEMQELCVRIVETLHEVPELIAAANSREQA
jgi:HAD superfamily hydrolase (TIGR01509 family)